MSILDQLSPQMKTGGTIALIVLVVIGFVFYGKAEYNGGQSDKNNEWLLKIATEPVTRETTFVYEKIPSTVQYLKGDAIVKIDSTLADSLRKETIYWMYKFETSEAGKTLTAEATLKDSIDGTHHITYMYATRKFMEEYEPSPRVREIMRITERQELPYEIKKRWFVGFTGEFHREPGFGAVFGVKPLGLGVSYFPESRSVLYRTEITWEF